MKIVSYAQNGEDIMLSRALRGVAHGFYVDIGAAGPTEHSVTRTFYDRGWTGINVEPTQRYFDELSAARPHDTNVQAAVDDAEGERTFYAFEGTGLSTLDSGVAEGHRPGGWPMTRIVTPTRTLAGLCADHAPPTIHFLKIDVEGAEDRVLRGADFTRFRPWIVVVEATRPMSPEPDYAGWEPILTGAGYEFVWFDGLNRFYLANEQLAALRGHFVVPISYFDDFDLYDPAAERLAIEAGSLRGRLAIAEDSAQALRIRNQGTEAELAAARAASHGAAVAAAAADAAGVAARDRLDLLQHALDEMRRQLHDARADHAGRLAAERAGHEAVRAADRAEHAAALAAGQAGHEAERVAERARHAALLAAVEAPPAPVVMVPPPAPPSLPRRLVLAVYRALLRPVLRPAMWRTRSFLVAAMQHEQLRQRDEQRQALADLAARVDWMTARSTHAAERVENGVRLIDATLVPLRVMAAAPVAPATPPPDLSGLVATLESALLTLTVTADARQVAAE